MCCDHVEGGLYIGPEFQLGQVYDGTLGMEEGETVVLYRPVYVCVRKNISEANDSNDSKQGNTTAGNGSTAGPSNLTNNC